ncbi:carbamoyltransferase C-terminal domain-containing protein [Burkholderia cepacia]|uniref:carbamoyltransferase C-terminal domain-containing protein n=1 Tax=Burkholderia cepacia TaxID=292 RepID=UPI001CF51AD9|nr:carbamoyltransferase C-terminal domain-containing protein [Burkholderia cepacia]MCA8318571.1 proline dehydrogenase [Burkholderia cepacia]
MLIVAFKPGHDGHIACVKDGVLNFSYEAEKDSNPRYASVGVELFVEACSEIGQIPDAIGISGWSKGDNPESGTSIGGGYSGLALPPATSSQFFGKTVRVVADSHERSHIMCAYGMSPFPQGQACYALVWEGHIGSFYFIDEDVRIRKLGDVLKYPGMRYAFAYGVGDPKFNLRPGQIRLGDAGKLMALAAYGRRADEGSAEYDFVSDLLSDQLTTESLDKRKYSESVFFNAGVESQAIKDIARTISDGMFELFFNRVRTLVDRKAPLLISGGCGLNCDWNRQWVDSDLFSDVFVPPCPNDVGSAIGTAIDSQFLLTGSAKIEWDVYRGQSFVDDSYDVDGFRRNELDYRAVAELLHCGAILGWADGRAEVGPRALGNRSILAAPFEKSTLDRLNAIKQRESFRPIAPMCLEERATEYFDLHGPSPHMLYFARVKRDSLKAVTHVDGSSRPQTVNPSQNPKVHALLKAFEAVSGVGALCNTSLNFNGAGFINRTSDLARYARETGLDGFVARDKLYIKSNPK